MTRLQGLGTPILTQVGPMRYTDLTDLFDAQVVKGRHYAVKTRWLADLTPDIRSVWGPNFDGLVARVAANFKLSPIEVGISTQKRIDHRPQRANYCAFPCTATIAMTSSRTRLTNSKTRKPPYATRLLPIFATLRFSFQATAGATNR